MTKANAHRKPQEAKLLADLVGKAMTPACRKRGFASVDIVAAWADIVGEKYGTRVQPDKLVWPRRPELTDPEAQKSERGIPLELASCHTIEADGYVFEGHVPFAALEAVLQDRPNITGLAVPGMPMGSPGMGNAPSARYDVIAFGGEAGTGTVYYRAGTVQPFDT